MIGRDGVPFCTCLHPHKNEGQCRNVTRNQRCLCKYYTSSEAPRPAPAPRTTTRRQRQVTTLAGALAAMGVLALGPPPEQPHRRDPS